MVEVGNLYGLFFESLARGASAPVLKWRLWRANRAFERLDGLTHAREAYLDAVEAEERRGSHQTAEPEGIGLTLEKSAMEVYIDDAERRLAPAKGPVR